MIRTRGRNLAESLNKSLYKFAGSNEPCIFLSHISTDKDAAVTIGNYLLDAGFNIYLDINDPALQRAVLEENATKITECIEEGISTCTHIMCMISLNTVRSWWVPYEIGFAKKANKEITTLFLKTITDIPEYLRITEMLLGTESLNKYLEGLMKLKFNKTLLLEDNIYKSQPYQKEGYLIKASSMSHPLDTYLNWKK